MSLIFCLDIVTKEKSCKSTSTSWMWPGVLSPSQTCLDLSGVNLVGHGVI